MDRDTGWDAWAGWPGPTTLRSLLPGGAGGPAAAACVALEALLRSAARRLTGRRVTVPGTGGALSLCLESLHVRPEPVGLALGQLDDVRVVATAVRWRGIEAHRAVLVCHNVHVRPLPAPTVVAAPVTLEVALRPAVVRDRLAAARPALRLEVVGDEARMHWSRRPRWGALVVTPEVTAGALLLRPRALRRGRRRVALPPWLPAARTAIPALPRGLRLRGVVVGAEEIVLHLYADEWREPVPPARLTALLAGLLPSD
jgi:hypothetical protein